MKNKILVTGTAGFIGFHLTERLMKEGWDIVGLDNINDYYDVNLKYARLKENGICKKQIEYNKFVISEKYEKYRFVKLNLEDKENILKLFEEEKFEYVVNLAAQAGVRYSLENPYAYLDSNIYGFLNILEGCRNYPVKHLLYASSSSVYGNNTKLPFSENDNVDQPISLYAATKKSNELMAHTYSHLFEIPTTGLRFFTVYGPWGRPDMALFNFTKKILAGEPINVYNYGKMKRDFTYVSDIVEGITLLLAKMKGFNDGVTLYNLFNIGNNKPIELLQFINILERTIGKKAKINLLEIQPGDVPQTYANIDRLYEFVNYKPTTRIETGIKNFINWFKNYTGDIKE